MSLLVPIGYLLIMVAMSPPMLFLYGLGLYKLACVAGRKLDRTPDDQRIALPRARARWRSR